MSSFVKAYWPWLFYLIPCYAIYFLLVYSQRQPTEENPTGRLTAKDIIVGMVYAPFFIPGMALWVIGASIISTMKKVPQPPHDAQ